MIGKADSGSGIGVSGPWGGNRQEAKTMVRKTLYQETNRDS